MSATHSKTGLSGLDLRQAWATSWRPWLKVRTEWLRDRLAPADPVLLLRPDGSRSVWVGDTQLEGSASTKKPKFVAVEIPDELLLRRTLSLPNMSQGHTDEAIQLEVRSNSPFAPEDLAWGCTVRELANGHRRAEIVIASRRHISDFIQAKWAEQSTAEPPEVWAVEGLPAPIVLTGYGEQRRLSHARSQQRWDWALLVLACVLASLAAMTPTAQLRMRALEAGDAFQAVMTRAAPLVRKRDELALLNDRLRLLDAAVADRIDPAQVLEHLTQILPDDTHLYALEIRKEKITASGHTVDASALLQKLSSDPRLKDVRSPTAVTRAPGATKEAFTVEFTMDVKQPAVGPAPLAATGSALGASAAASTVPGALAPAIAAAAPASSAIPAASSAAKADAALPVPATATPPKPAAKPASSSPFVIGGAAR